MSTNGDKKETKKNTTTNVPTTTNSGSATSKTGNSDKNQTPNLKQSENNVRKFALSPRRSMLMPKRKPSKRSISMEQEPSANEEELSVAPPSLRQSPFSPQTPPAPTPDCLIPPPFHFVPVVVTLLPQMTPEGSLDSTLRLTTNMLVGTVRKEFMPYFMSGDLICSINGTVIWNREHLHRVLLKVKPKETLTNPIQMTVVRPFNVKPPTPQHLQHLTVIDERFHYFVVRMGLKTLKGFSTRFDKRRLVVTKIKTGTSPSHALLVGDQILSVGPYNIPAKPNKKTHTVEMRRVITAGKNFGYIDVFGCRPISARSSPCPSVDGEMGERFVFKREKTAEELLNTPLEGDSLEIAYRELVCLKECIKPELPLPYTAKGRSLLRSTSNNNNNDTKTANQNTTTTLTASGSSTNISADRSVYMPTTSSAASSTTMTSGSGGTAITAGTPRRFKWNAKQMKRQQSISIQEPADTTKITSDVAEESELKKCDPRSGIVAYIKNAFNN